MLFDDYVRTDMIPSSNNEATFAFLNRSGSAAVGRIRNQMEIWLSHYPEEHRADLVARLRVQFDSAFFELLLYTYLRAIGGVVECHPDIDGSNNHPDYHVLFANGHEAYVEAIAISDSVKAGGGEHAVRRQVYDEINKVVSCDFFVGVDSISILSDTQPTVKRLRAFLERELPSCDPDTVEAGMCEGDRAQLHFADDGLNVHMTIYPKAKQYRAGPPGRLIGSYPIQTGWGDGEGEILKAIYAKSTKYGQLGKPFIVAVNALSSWGRYGKNILSMLLGPVDPANISRIIENPTFRRGAWHRGGAPVNTRVSAVLLTTTYPWYLFTQDVCLYHNPWATSPCAVGDWGVPEISRKNDAMERGDGHTFAELLNLQGKWPGDLFE